MVYPKKVYFMDKVFVVDEHVYEPAEDTFLLAERLTVTKNDFVLDVGTGCGILAILAAKKAKRVVAVEVNPYAIECASKNAQTNEVEDRIDFRQGDLFQPIKQNEKFDVIMFNSPYLPSEPDEEKSWIGKAWAGGPDGRAVIDRFLVDFPNYLGDGGKVQLVQSSLSNVEKTIQMFKERNLKAKVAAQVKVAFEIIVLIEAEC
ncbi:MAG: class I SAM-dependent methyltransferase [Candidatus Bathyarchaeota archaeon]|jgi:release factor glutamine methyltransferase